MKKSILCYFLLLIPIGAFSQIQNGGFETWDDVFLYESPEVWRTTHTEIPGTDAVDKNTDAQDGTFSVHLKTVDVLGEKLFGYVLIGEADDDDYTGVPYSGTISSINGYYKSDIQTGDSALVLVAASYQGVDYDPEFFYLHGEETNWTSFSFSFTQSMQVDSVTIGIASSDAINESAVEGSWILVDNISFQGSNAPALSNHSFEDWEDISYEKPDGWFINLYGAGVVAPIVKSTNAYSGSYAIEILSIDGSDIGDDTISGILTNGVYTSTDSLIFSGGVPFTLEPEELMGYYIATDTIHGLIEFWNNSDIVEHEYIQLLPAGNTYQSFTVPLDLSAAPDSMLIYFFSGNELGSSVLLDDLTLLGGNVGVQELNFINNFKIYPNPNAETLYYSYAIDKASKVSVILYDIQGRMVYNGQSSDLNPGEHTGQLDITKLKKGTYLFNLLINGQVYEQKVVID